MFAREDSSLPWDPAGPYASLPPFARALLQRSHAILWWQLPKILLIQRFITHHKEKNAWVTNGPKNAADNSTLSWRNMAKFSSKLAKDSVVEPPI
jgi:hypothetical protein